MNDRPFSLEAVVPIGMDPDQWDGDRALELWGCSRPEVDSSVVVSRADHVVYEVATVCSPPAAALRALSAAHPSVVVHTVATCESEYAWTAWFAHGQVVGERELGLDLSEQEWEEWDGEWDLPADWSFSTVEAARLAG